MATKVKVKSKIVTKAVRRPARRPKSMVLKAKKALRPQRNSKRKPSAKVESRRTPSASAQPSAPPDRVRSKGFTDAIQAYETGLKLMHAENFEKAIKSFENLIAHHPEEQEIHERAKVLIHVCEKKIQEKARTVLRSADDHYNFGVAELNRRDLDSAVEHFQHALRLTPKGDHILYALAAASALKGNRDEAVGYLKQAIHHRPENRFLALRDTDFENLHEDSNFKQLVTPLEK